VNSKDIVNGIKSRLAGTPDAPSAAWPNVSFDPATVPRFEVSFPSRRLLGGTLRGDEIFEEEGVCRVIVCTELGTGEDAGNDYVDAIAARFPEGFRFDVTGGEIIIMSRVTVDGSAFPDDTCYRLPCQIRYLARAD